MAVANPWPRRWRALLHGGLRLAAGAARAAAGARPSSSASDVVGLAMAIEPAGLTPPPDRMVLDPKSGGNHNDYGSISAEAEGDAGQGGAAAGANGTATAGNGIAPNGTGTAGTGAAPQTAPAMTQSDLYQRQPLLVAQEDGAEYEREEGAGVVAAGGGGGKRHPANAANSNGVVRIDVAPGACSRDEPRFPKERTKTLIAFLIMAANLVLSTVSLALVHERVPNRAYPPLPDIVLDNLNAHDWALDVSEILIMVSTNVTVFVVLLHKHRFIVFRRIFLIMSLLYFMRSITMYVTVLPVASTTYHCSEKVNQTSVKIVAKRAFQLISGFGLSINGKHTYCGDYIYSGHTIMLVMSYLVVSEYSPKRLWPLQWASGAAAVAGVVFVLVARGHYTIDVVIAYWVTTRVFWMYHTLANHAMLKHSSANNLLSRVWWFRLFGYFEGGVGGPVPRVHEWPLPWPRRFLAKHPNRDS